MAESTGEIAAADQPARSPDMTAASSAPMARPEAAAQPAPRPARSDRRVTAAEAEAPADGKGSPGAFARQAAGADPTARPGAARAEGPTPVDAAVAGSAPETAAPDGAPAVEARSAAHTETSPSASSTTAPVRGAPETVANLAAQIVKKLEGRSTRFDIELNPEGLGKVDVRVEIGANGRLTAALVFDSAQAAHDLRARATELQRALEQAGFDVSDGLTFDVAQDKGGGGQAWQDARSDLGEAFRGRAFRSALETADDAADVAAQGALKLRRGVNAGLDLRI